LLLPSSAAIAERPLAAGIWCNREKSNRLFGAHEDQLVRSLRRITGFRQLIFAEDGSLSLGDVMDVAPGSLIARQIIFRALGSGKTLIIEDHSGSQTVVFGQIDLGLDFEDRVLRQKFEIWRLRIDFDDFREIEAPPEVRQSFDAGFIVMHELLHGIGYEDTRYKEGVGEVEGLVNQVRAELGLPLRDRYFGEFLQVTSRIATFRLRFRKEIKPAADGHLKRERLDYLFFVHPVKHGRRWLKQE